jgi:hypothetical protein
MTIEKNKQNAPQLVSQSYMIKMLRHHDLSKEICVDRHNLENEIHENNLIVAQ